MVGRLTEFINVTDKMQMDLIGIVVFTALPDDGAYLSNVMKDIYKRYFMSRKTDFGVHPIHQSCYT